MRYRFYREHKYLIFLLFELERLIAKTDFRVNDQILKIKEKLSSFAALLKGHGIHEENALHVLLKNKDSQVHEKVEREHQHHEEQSFLLDQKLDAILKENENLKVSLGYEFYLAYRLFLIENLQHFHQEETVIMSELQRLYSDDELKKVERNTYHHMTPQEMIEMMQILSPHMDPNDKAFFLNDIKEADLEKFVIVSENFCR
ncbi:MAG: hypothetical protein HYX61_12780 [Gammaproteobacteria bacterium]|jgi:hemerythrin-like domain-containing protein|nr:hypothetical protein [Gammaproteobacteria bacterium]